MSTLRLELFGGLRVWLDGASVTGFYSNKVPALFAYLALTKRPHSRDHLATLLWGEMPDADAKTNLRQALANLRKLLDPFLDIQRDAVAVQRDAVVETDVDEFLRIRDWKQDTGDALNAPSVAGPSPAPGPNLQSLLSLYRGDFLEGIFLRDAPEFEEWAIAERARLRELALNAFQDLAAQSTLRGEYRQAIEYAKKVLTLDPWREEAHREVMLLYARLGERSAALAQYTALTQILREQLRVEPSYETNTLYERIRAAGDTPKHKLPLQPTSFVGRAQELARVETLLLDPRARLITIVGGGGSGKTRLALQAAERAGKLGMFLNGVAFVSLVGVDAIAQIAPAIAIALGIPLPGDTEANTLVADYLREKEMLVVLDNMEQLLDAVNWFGEILPAAPGVKFIVTSREKLNTRWERLVPLEGLEYTSANSNAAELFIERARHIVPGFQLDETNQAAVVRVCHLVEGMPLALELAAGAVGRYTCDDIATGLERNFSFLETTLRDVPARQRSLRAVFEHSWNLLDVQERSAWSKLAVFCGGWTREAARAIAGALPGELTTLTDKSLVRASVSNRETRYDMHELARQFARAKLEQDAPQVAVLRTRHSEYFAAYVAAFESALKGAGNQDALAAITREFENVSAGWEWAWTGHSLPAWQTIRAYMEPLFVVLEMRGAFAFGAQLYARARAQVEALTERPPEALHVLGQLFIREGWMCFRLGHFSETVQQVEKGLPLLEEAGDSFELAYGLLFMGAAAYGLGDLAQSQRYFESSLALYEKRDDAWGRAGTLNNLGQIAMERQDYEGADKLLLEAFRIARSAHISHMTAHVLNNLALLSLHRQDSKNAQHFLEQALEIANERGEPHVIALSMAHLARALAADDPARASEMGQEALRRLREFGDRSNMLELLRLLGSVKQRQDERAAAATFWGEALSLARDMGAAPQVLAEIEDALGRVQPS